MTRAMRASVFGLLMLLAMAAQAPAAGAAAASAGGAVVVLDATGFWRMHHTLKPPVVALPGGPKPILLFQRWLNTETAEPAANWQTTDFDDAEWVRAPARWSIGSPYVSRICLRGKFSLDNPAAAGPLTLSVDYHGGIVVYLNGKEVTRRNVAAGADVRTALATAYPVEAFVGEKGELLAYEGQLVARGKRMGANTPEDKRRLGLCKRTLPDFALPRESLRKGVNVLAIEIIRAPYDKTIEDFKKANAAKELPEYQLRWDTCQLEGIRLSGAAAAGVVANTSRSPGLQVWNGDPLAGDFAGDQADPCEKLHPVSIVAARNGGFSGKVIVGSSKPIQGLTVTPSDLRNGSSTLPAAAVQIRYGLPWGTEAGNGGRSSGVLLGAVAEVPLKEFPVSQGGATVPVWITVRPGKEAVAGVYTGQIKIAAGGETPVAVAVTVKVVDFTLPDPQNYKTIVELIESPDTLSLEYNEPLWSARHLAMIADSFRLISNTGTRVVHVPVIAHTNLGNAESMVRWIKKSEGRYDFDFTVMDKYLDAAKANLGAPKVLVLQVWDLYMSTKESVGKRFSPELEERHAASEGGRPQVTFLDQATGRTENGTVPNLDDPGSKATWTKLINEVRRHLKERGLDQALMFGMFTDARPSKEHIQFFHDIAPDVPWVQEGHGRWKGKIDGLAEIGFQASVWDIQFADGMIQQSSINKELPVTSLHGWKLPRIDLVFERNTGLDAYPATRWRFFAETGITGNLRGIGRIGADYWQTVRGKDGRRSGYAHTRFIEGTWSGGGIQLNLTNSVLAPGPTGPVATNRLLALNEGIQDCEARIVIEQALVDPALKAKLGPDLAKRCEEALDRRLDSLWKSFSNLDLAENFGAWAWRWTMNTPGHVWYLGSDRRQQSETLYGLAGEVARKTGPQ